MIRKKNESSVISLIGDDLLTWVRTTLSDQYLPIPVQFVAVLV